MLSFLIRLHASATIETKYEHCSSSTQQHITHTSLNLYNTTFGEIGVEHTIVGCPVLCQATVNIDLVTVIVHEDAFELMEWPNSVMTHVQCVVEIVADHRREYGIQGREVKPDSVGTERMRVRITVMNHNICKHVNRWWFGWVHEKLQEEE